jgi:hypothetical protein
MEGNPKAKWTQLVEDFVEAFQQQSSLDLLEATVALRGLAIDTGDGTHHGAVTGEHRLHGIRHFAHGGARPGGIHAELQQVLVASRTGGEATPDAAELDCLHRLLDQRVDGIVFWPSDETVPNHYLEEVWKRGVPLVAVDRQLPHTRADFSGTDDVAGGRIAAEHLLELGHRRLAILCGEPWVSTYADRRQGFVEAANVNPVTEMVQMIEINRAYENNQKMIQNLKIELVQ